MTIERTQKIQEQKMPMKSSKKILKNSFLGILYKVRIKPYVEVMSLCLSMTQYQCLSARQIFLKFNIKDFH
jgi:hypothetical protein